MYGSIGSVPRWRSVQTRSRSCGCYAELGNDHGLRLSCSGSLQWRQALPRTLVRGTSLFHWGTYRGIWRSWERSVRLSVCRSGCIRFFLFKIADRSVNREVLFQQVNLVWAPDRSTARCAGRMRTTDWQQGMGGDRGPSIPASWAPIQTSSTMVTYLHSCLAYTTQITPSFGIFPAGWCVCLLGTERIGIVPVLYRTSLHITVRNIPWFGSLQDVACPEAGFDAMTVIRSS